MPTFGHFLRTEREKRNLTQSQFGEKIGLNTSAISRIENESQRFSKSKLKALSELFQIEEQVIKDLYFADKFAREAFQYSCSETIFSVAEQNVKYIKQKKETQGQIEFK
jgi:transcriptional regulator with XRE-family HTH domain